MRNMDKKTKVAIITGAGRGIGRGIAIQLARAGWTIVINDFGNPDPPAETLDLVAKKGSDGLVVLANITDAADRQNIVDETIKEYGQIDLLVNNAGIGPRVRMDMLEISEESMNEVLAVNTIGPYFLTQLVSKKMIDLIHKRKLNRENCEYWIDQRIYKQYQPGRVLYFKSSSGDEYPALCRPSCE